jgi:hypothetical protein
MVAVRSFSGSTLMKIISVTGEKAIEELNRLQLEFTSSGLWPILIGDDQELERIEEGLEDSSESPDEILAASTAIHAEKWFEERISQDPELYQCEDGDWPDVDPGEIGIVTHLSISGSKPKKKVSIALLAIDNSSDSFAHLNWGGWNDCPFPQDHCAIHRYWRAKTVPRLLVLPVILCNALFQILRVIVRPLCYLQGSNTVIAMTSWIKGPERLRLLLRV